MKRKLLIGVCIVVAAMILLNPSPENFKSYIAVTTGLPHQLLQCGRTANYFLFSRYEYTYQYGGNWKRGSYIGFMGNFWKF